MKINVQKILQISNAKKKISILGLMFLFLFIMGVSINNQNKIIIPIEKTNIYNVESNNGVKIPPPLYLVMFLNVTQDPLNVTKFDEVNITTTFNITGSGGTWSFFNTALFFTNDTNTYGTSLNQIDFDGVNYTYSANIDRQPAFMNVSYYAGIKLQEDGYVYEFDSNLSFYIVNGTLPPSPPSIEISYGILLLYIQYQTNQNIDSLNRIIIISTIGAVVGVISGIVIYRILRKKLKKDGIREGIGEEISKNIKKIIY